MAATKKVAQVRRRLFGRNGAKGHGQPLADNCAGVIGGGRRRVKALGIFYPTARQNPRKQEHERRNARQNRADGEGRKQPAGERCAREQQKDERAQRAHRVPLRAEGMFFELFH